MPQPTPVLSQGIIDLHLNGLTVPGLNRGLPEIIDFSAEDLTLDQVRRATAQIVSGGTTKFLATLITGTPETTERNVGILAEAMKHPWGDPILGVHLEGPFFSRQCRGAHQEALVREEADIGLFRRFFDAADGKIVLTTVSPAIRGAAPFIEEIIKMGVVVSIGHHNADVTQIKEAFAAGATGVTHAGNAWSKEAPPDGRKNMEVITQLINPNSFVMVIPDGVHVNETFIQCVYTVVESVKPGRIIWVSDGSAFAGAPEGDYTFGGETVRIGRDERGAIRTFPLTGSYLSLSECLDVLRAMCIVPEVDIRRGATSNPLSFVSGALERINRCPDISTLS
jgi:N-acetylglucosamine-6-phosphate deacetylase